MKLDDIVINKEVDYLDITLTLEDGTYKPFRKANSSPVYVDVRSNHPKSIIEQIPNMVNKRLSMLSSDENRFNQAKPIYQQALNQAGHKHTLVYNKPDDDAKRKSRNRKRNISWFNPPYDLTVKTNIGKKTLMLVDKHFKKEKN